MCEQKKFILSPSLLACNFANPLSQLEVLEKECVPYIHLDVMDGIFVPNISFGQPVLKSLRKATKLVFDTHLMITDPMRYIDSFIASGADIITVHCEAADNIPDVLKYIRSKGIKAAVSIKPKTSPKAIEDMLPLCDMVLVMSVEPGFGGQKLIPSSIDHISELAEMRAKHGLDFDIEVDGGIDATNVKSLVDAGANVIVAGSSVLGKSDIAKAIKELYEAV